MTRNYEQMSVAEIRQILKDEYGYTDSEVMSLKGKSKTAFELSKCDANYDNEIQSGFASIEPEATLSEDDSEPAEIVPNMGTPEWENYVLSQLFDNEKDTAQNGVDVYPKCFGLRRLANKLLGPIVESGPTQVFPPDIDGRATIVYRVVIDWSRSYNEKDLRVFSEAADCGPQNTPDPYSKHPVATASTKAESRALKKALQLTILTSEEMSHAVKGVLSDVLGTTPDNSGNEPASQAQKDSIKFVCGRISIDAEKFVEQELPNVKLENASREEAANLLAKLSQYQSKGKSSLEIPNEIKVVNGN